MDYIEACADQKWHLRLWDVGADGELSPPRLVPFRCRSWRHEGDCRRWCAACDFARINDALEAGDHWSHLVLTYPGRDWSRVPVSKLFRFGVAHWKDMRRKLIREIGPMKYIQTWEVHKSGIPHVHVAISNQKLYRKACWCDEYRRDMDVGNTPWLLSVLRPMCVSCRFGKIVWLGSMREADGFAGYLTKLAREMTGGGKDYQIPLKAPRHWRRIRASRHTLPPRIKHPHMTGELLHYPITPLNQP